MLHIQGGTIHPPDKSGGILYPSTPRYKMLNKFLSPFRKPESLMSEPEVHQLISAVIDTSQIEGDIAEVGVYQGGSAKIICQIKGTKALHLFDTFNGLPYSDDIYKKGDYRSHYELVKRHFKKYHNVFIYKGIFPETAITIKKKTFSMVHLDVDVYKSTIDCLNFFYPRMNKGGIILIHDYIHSKGVTRAVNDFFKDKPEQMVQIDNQCKAVKL